MNNLEGKCIFNELSDVNYVVGPGLKPHPLFKKSSRPNEKFVYAETFTALAAIYQDAQGAFATTSTFINPQGFLMLVRGQDAQGETYIELSHQGVEVFKLLVHSYTERTPRKKEIRFSRLDSEGTHYDFIKDRRGIIRTIPVTHQSPSILELNVFESIGNTPEDVVPDELIVGPRGESIYDNSKSA